MKLSKILLLMSLSVTALFSQGELNLQLLGTFNPRPASGYNDIWGYTAPDGSEYALLGVKNGTSVIAISNPSNPVEIGFIPSNNSTWKDIKTFSHYAYVVIDQTGNGLQIIDLSNLPNNVSLVNTYTGNGFASSHNIYIDEDAGILYAQGGGGVRVISLADPVNPIQLTVINAPSVHDVYASDGKLFVSEGWNFSYSIWDVSNPATPYLTGRFFTPSSGYAHNAWATEDNRYVMTTEEVPANNTVKMWDIQDPGNPTLLDEYLASPGGRPHNTHIKGHYAYISHYWDGLRIVDISDPANLHEVAFYDTYPAPGSGFEGNWGAYPFFNSGKVLASDQVTGLYILHFSGAVTTSTAPMDDIAPNGFHLVQNYPNPFNPSTTINYTVPGNGEVTLTVFDISGKKVKTLIQSRQVAGSSYSVSWDAKNDYGIPVSTGIYFYELKFEGTNQQFREVKRMVYLK
jgi:choice-of-anchor B domain-containing protein